MRVMIVEDEASLADVLGEFIRDLGHETVLVHDAEAALGIVQRVPPEVILLDINLPGMSGLDFLRVPSLRALGVPVIVMSGVVTEAQAREALALGAIDFLAKPVELDRLTTILDFVAPSPPRRMSPGEPDRRPARRIRITFDVRITHKHTSWGGTCMELSASGMKAASDEPARRGFTLRLSFTPPDNERLIDVLALVVRVDADGIALWFLDLDPADAARINRLVMQTPS